MAHVFTVGTNKGGPCPLYLATNQYQLKVDSTTRPWILVRCGSTSRRIYPWSFGSRFSYTTRSASSSSATTQLLECKSIPPYSFMSASSGWSTWFGESSRQTIALGQGRRLDDYQVLQSRTYVIARPDPVPVMLKILSRPIIGKTWFVPYRKTWSVPYCSYCSTIVLFKKRRAYLGAITLSISRARSASAACFC